MFFLLAKQTRPVDQNPGVKKPIQPQKPLPPKKPVANIQQAKPVPKPQSAALDLGGLMKANSLNMDLCQQILDSIQNIYETLNRFFKDKEAAKISINQIMEEFRQETRKTLSKTSIEEADLLVMKRALDRFLKSLSDFLETNRQPIIKSSNKSNPDDLEEIHQKISAMEARMNDAPGPVDEDEHSAPFLALQNKVDLLEKKLTSNLEPAAVTSFSHKLSEQEKKIENLTNSVVEISRAIKSAQAELTMFLSKKNIPEKQTLDRISILEGYYQSLESVVTGLNSLINDDGMTQVREQIKNLFLAIGQMQITLQELLKAASEGKASGSSGPRGI